MPTLFSAKDIAEQSLQKIGRFPTTEDQANAVDLARALRMLETITQDFFGGNTVTSAWGTLQIPLTASTLEYPLSDYQTDEGVQFVYGAELIDVSNSGWRVLGPIKVVNEKKFFSNDITQTGIPAIVYVDKGIPPIMQINPILGAEVAADNYKILLQIQTFATRIVTRGIGAKPIDLRPTYYLWAITKLAYQLGNGTIRRLPEAELTRLQKDYMDMETKLQGFDANENDDQPFTEPWGQ